MSAVPAPNLPFVYICSLARTGSTVLTDALTVHPYGFILSEPLLLSSPGLYLAELLASLKDHPALQPTGIDMEALAAAYLKRKGPQKSGIPAFMEVVLPALQGAFAQVGVKEIYHTRWDWLVERIPDLKAVLTARDPRDIYISLMEMGEHFTAENWRWRNLKPEEIARRLMEDFAKQREVANAADSIRVRYEDLCRQPEAELTRVKAFVRSPIPSVGEIGALTRENVNRSYEHARHGGRVSTASVERWRRETRPERIEGAQRVAERMREYMEYFGYL